MKFEDETVIFFDFNKIPNIPVQKLLLGTSEKTPDLKQNTSSTKVSLVFFHPGPVLYFLAEGYP